MAEIIHLRKGLDIPLKGGIDTDTVTELKAAEVAVVPDDFPSMAWKLTVKPGDSVKRGTALLRDKETGTVAIVSPAAGTVKEVRRGERRKIEAVVVEVSDNQSQEEFHISSDSEALKELLCSCGLWAMMRQRPYDIVPSPAVTPRDIFITASDTAPLAAPLLSADLAPYLEDGIEAIAKLTSGKVYLGTAFGSGITSAAAKVVEFQGKHPAGNVGVQISNIKPVNKGETVWALDARTVARIGKLVKTGELDSSTIVALTGEEMKNPHLVSTTVGVKLSELLNGELKERDHHQRVISGNVLTGIAENLEKDYLRWPYRQVTAIPEGDDADEFMGWASMDPKKYSVKRSFPAFIRGLSKPFSFDARLKGGRRAPILSGECEKVFPMDIYPEFLLKAIRAKDIDRMEQLGIYEVAPEDFALCEFVDTSKEPLQAEVREGLEYLRKELR